MIVITGVKNAYKDEQRFDVDVPYNNSEQNGNQHNKSIVYTHAKNPPMASFILYIVDYTFSNPMRPIQYQKHLRLQEVSRLLLSESSDASSVAFQVVYENVFIFDY